MAAKKTASKATKAKKPAAARAAAATPKVARKAAPAKKPAKAKARASTATARKAPARRANHEAEEAVIPVITDKNPASIEHAGTYDPADEGDETLLTGPRNVQPYIVKRGEQYMSKEQLDHFRTILQSWKHDLMLEVDRTVSHMQDEAANFPDPNDRATQEEEFSLELRARDRERKLIKKIDQTIDRIDQDDYGFCDSCGVEIGIRRLEARPTATLCIDCKTLAEIREKQTGI